MRPRRGWHSGKQGLPADDRHRTCGRWPGRPAPPATTSGPWVEFYLNGVLLTPQVDYTTVFDYAAGTFSAVLTVAPIAGDEIAFGFMRGCFDGNDDLGGRPEERIVTEVCDSVNICVPTPLSKTRDPDISFIDASVERIAETLHRDQLIILESTTYPGTTEEVILPRLQDQGLHVGSDFFLAFSPERVDPGNPNFSTKNIPKVVGGITPACTEMVPSSTVGTCTREKFTPIPFRNPGRKKFSRRAVPARKSRSRS